MAAPPKPSLVKTWAVFGAAAVLLVLVAVMTDVHAFERIPQWQSITSWFLSLLFGALGVTFAIQLVHCTALSSFWPSLVVSLLVTVLASLAFADRLSWGAGISIGLLGIACLGFKAWTQNGRE